MEQELFTNQEHLSSPPVFSGVRNTQSLVFYLVFCRSFVVLLSCFLFNPLYWLSFLDLWLLITPLVSSKNSYLKTISLINMHAYYIFRIHRFDKRNENQQIENIHWMTCLQWRLVYSCYFMDYSNQYVIFKRIYYHMYIPLFNIYLQYKTNII